MRYAKPFNPNQREMLKYAIVLCCVAWAGVAVGQEIPPYIKQCRRSDPALTDCLKEALEHLRPYLSRGIPEIKLPSVEPFVMDQLSLQLTGGPQGYRINLKNMEVFGASNFTVRSIKLADGTKPFEARLTIPRLTIHAKYTSSGVLIIIPASGSGDFDAVFDGVTADVKGLVSTNEKPSGTHLRVEKLDLNLSIKKPRLSVSKIFNNNRILTEATNLFLKENGHEVLRALQPQLQKKLSGEFTGIANQLLDNVPIHFFIVD
uniref:Hemolymph juvenile hormone binding protein n=1 Tax=Anopheles farauti TaxID=69004 RepID=A0A182QYS3_9DIPT